MTKRYFIALAAAVTLLNASETFGQFDSSPIAPGQKPTRIYVGPIGGINLVQHTGEFASFASSISNLCPTFQGGSSVGFYAGLSAEYLLGDPAQSTSSIILRVMYDTRPATFSETDDAPNVYLLPFGDETRPTSVLSQYYARAGYTMINADILYKYSLGNSGLAVTGGLAFGLVNTATVREEWRLLEPLEVQFDRDRLDEEFQFENNDRTVIFRDGDIPEKTAFRLGLKVGLQYEITMSRVFIVPGVWYDFGLTNVNATDSWRVNALQLGVDIRFAL